MQTLSQLWPLFCCLGFLLITHGMAAWGGYHQVWRKRIVFVERGTEYAPVQTIVDDEGRGVDLSRRPRAIEE